MISNCVRVVPFKIYKIKTIQNIYGILLRVLLAITHPVEQCHLDDHIYAEKCSYTYSHAIYMLVYHVTNLLNVAIYNIYIHMYVHVPYSWMWGGH